MILPRGKFGYVTKYRSLPGDDVILIFDSHRPLHSLLPHQSVPASGVTLLMESRIDAYPDARCHRIESLVQGPKLALVNSRPSEQVSVYIPNASAVKFLRADESHYLVVVSDGYRTQLLQKLKRCFTVREVAAGEFAHDERMHDNFAAAETLAEFVQVVAKVINPD